jgi:hypothetical protein
MSPNSNQLTFTEQVPTYSITVPEMLNSVAAALAGWVAGPFLLIPLVGVIGRSAVIFYSPVRIFACQIWGAHERLHCDGLAGIDGRGMHVRVRCVLGGLCGPVDDCDHFERPYDQSMDHPAQSEYFECWDGDKVFMEKLQSIAA